MDEQIRRDENYDRKRLATETDRNDRSDEISRRHDRARTKEQLTRREREERWPVD